MTSPGKLLVTGGAVLVLSAYVLGGLGVALLVAGGILFASGFFAWVVRE